jgi:hypothetical protein
MRKTFFPCLTQAGFEIKLRSGQESADTLRYVKFQFRYWPASDPSDSQMTLFVQPAEIGSGGGHGPVILQPFRASPRGVEAFSSGDRVSVRLVALSVFSDLVGRLGHPPISDIVGSGSRGT